MHLTIFFSSTFISANKFLLDAGFEPGPTGIQDRHYPTVLCEPFGCSIRAVDEAPTEN